VYHPPPPPPRGRIAKVLPQDKKWLGTALVES